MKKNQLRELLKAGKPTLGTRLISPWPRMVEVIGHTGAFDYIEYVGEYSTFTIEQFENFGRAIDLFPDMSSMIKVEEQTRGFIATRAIDAGIQNVLFTDCRNADDVRECIRLVRSEAPGSGGTHGYGIRRITMGSNPREFIEALDNVVIAFMIEKKSAVENLEEILSVPGVDMVQFGPMDYSISAGMLGEGRGPNPEVQKAQDEMIRMALEKGVAPRVEIMNSEAARRYIEMGVRHFNIGMDIAMVGQFCQQQGKAMREMLGD